MIIIFISVPSAVSTFSISLVFQNAILITWKSTDNYRVSYYHVRYRSLCPESKSEGSIAIQKGHYTYNITGLDTGTGYTVSIRAGNSVGLSEPVSIIKRTLPAGNYKHVSNKVSAQSNSLHKSL